MEWVHTGGSRRLLRAAFGGLLALIALVGGYSLAVFDRARASDVAVRARVVARGRALDRLRNGIFLSGTLARDFVLAPDDALSAGLRERLTRLKAETLAALEEASPENAALTSLRGEVLAYWKLLEFMLDVGGKRRSIGAFFYRQLGERRENMLRIAGQVAALGEAESRAGETEVERLHRRAWWSAAAAFGLALAGGTLLAGFTVRSLLRLEADTSRARADFEELSARLVRAQEEERRAVARELHDGVGQSLSALLVEAGNAQVEGAGAARPHLESIQSLAERAVQAVRDMALALRPSMLDDLGLAPALEWQAREVARRTGLKIQVSADAGAADLPDEHRTQIYRIAQEALANCARHARAAQVRLTLKQEQRRVTLEVRDDGVGFDPARVRGLGLLGMEERASRLGGRLTLDAAPGRGTTLVVEIPLPPTQERKATA